MLYSEDLSDVSASVGQQYASRARSMAGRVLLRVGRGMERRLKRSGAITLVYKAARKVAPDDPVILVRLGRLRECRQDWAGAEKAYTEAIALDPRDVASFRTGLVRVLEKQGRWSEAMAEYGARPGVKPSRALLSRIAAGHRRAGRVPEAVAAYAAVVERRRTSTALARLAECHAALGAYGEAIRIYREAVDLDPDSLTVRTDLAHVAARRSLVPFDVTTDHRSPAPRSVREQSLEEAVEQYEFVLGASGSRVWAAYWLGRLLESHGRLDSALRAYAEAVARVQTVDLPWAHHAERSWRFRHEYVENRVTGASSSDDRISRTVAALGPYGDVTGVAGFFDAFITNVGLHVEGFVVRGHDRSVEVCLDGSPILGVSTNESGVHRDFKVTIVHGVLADFPDRAQLTLRHGDATLATVDGSRSAAVWIPGGTGKLAAMLGDGRTITKKGRWSDSVLRTGENDQTFLAAYAKVRTFFQDELGRELFLSYGTLLGCYRDGKLIPGDDDFDISFVADATSPDDLKKEGRNVIEALLRGGYDVRVAMDGRMFHLRVDSVVIDVNPFWFYNGRAWAFDGHNLTRDVFYPANNIRVYGMDVAVPRDTEAFLAENYGPEWRVPRSDFQYHRDKSDVRTLRRARLLPSEVRKLQEYSAQLSREDASAGRFYGYADPASPAFGELEH